jgi:peroxiredoxin (alkyl hydroperoxide reductase subunit C)
LLLGDVLADPDLEVAKLYEMIHPSRSQTAAMRYVLIGD